METLQDVLREFKDKFPPANNTGKTLLFSTSSIFEAIQRLSPGMVFMLEDLSEELKNNGYVYEAGFQDCLLQFRWKIHDRFGLWVEPKVQESSE